jgi:hypothetical protein
MIMEDDRVWAFEDSLWKADFEHYRDSIDRECLMVVPQPPFVLAGYDAIEAVSNTPRWTQVEFSDQHIARPQEGLIVVAYGVHATRDDAEPYQAHCTSTYRRLAHEQWVVVQHQQTPKIALSG